MCTTRSCSFSAVSPRSWCSVSGEAVVADGLTTERGRVHGGIEAAKWAAFALMAVDHFFHLALERFQPLAYLGGRLVFPLFALCLAFGLAGRGSLVLDGTIKRLLVWACIAQVPWAMFHSSGLNVVFTLAFGALVYQALFVRGLGWLRYLLAFAAFVFSPLSEFGLAGLVLVVGAMWFAESRSRVAAAVALFGLLALYVPNGTFFAVLGAPVFWGLCHYTSVPRVPHLFYWLYPAHLVVLGFLRWAL